MEQDAKKRLAVNSLFESNLHLLKNSSCGKCDARIRHPLLPWIIGGQFGESRERVLFVGKPHRGTPGKMLPSGLIDPIEEVPELWHSAWPYWSYTREIAENLYGSHAADFIAFTNLVKCTNVNADDGESTSTDGTTWRMVKCCVCELGVIWEEIKVLQPKTVVFYTYGLSGDSLREIPVALAGSITDITSRDHHVLCGRKKLGWWERSCRTSWTEALRLLVVGHPERMYKRDFVRLLTAWIRPQ